MPGFLPSITTPAFRQTVRAVAIIFAVAMLAACSSTPKKGEGTTSTKGGGYYSDDGPATTTLSPAELNAIPDAVPKPEPLNRFANRPYTVLGQTYTPTTSLQPYEVRGTASWYGKKFHGEKTSIGDTYDMFSMTAAHPTLPLPSYARVTNVNTGKSVVVRVNDRGPFLHDRVIDLSYAAAYRIGIAGHGTGEVIVQSILPGTVVADASAGVNTTTATTPAVPAVNGSRASTADTPLQTVSGGVIVQLGVFSNNANAEAFLAHVQDTLNTAQYSARIQQRNDGKYRVFIGPYTQRIEAKQAADRLSSAFGLTAFVTTH